MENETLLARQIPQSTGAQQVLSQEIESVIPTETLLMRRKAVEASRVALAWSPITWEAGTEGHGLSVSLGIARPCLKNK